MNHSIFHPNADRAGHFHRDALPQGLDGRTTRAEQPPFSVDPASRTPVLVPHSPHASPSPSTDLFGVNPARSCSNR
jgi:hypothetical protein